MGSVASRSGAGSKDPSRLIQEVEAIVASALGCFLVVCLLSYVPDSPDVNHGGLLGFTLANVLKEVTGWMKTGTSRFVQQYRELIQNSTPAAPDTG